MCKIKCYPTLCEFASEVNTQALPGEVVDRAALLVTDSIGVAIRARKEAESTPALLAAVARMGMDEGRGTVVADNKGYAFPAAALINGSLIHSLDFDDTHIAATVHQVRRYGSSWLPDKWQVRAAPAFSPGDCGI